MNTKIILGLSTALLLSTSAFAYGNQGQMKASCDGQKQAQYKMMDRKHHKGGSKFMHMVMKLDLSDSQKEEIRAIVKNSMKSMPNPNDAFSESSFDKQKFIELHQQRKDTKVQRKADMIEKVYAVLNASQKKDLKTMLDMKRIMKKNMNKQGKGGNCDSKACQNK